MIKNSASNVLLMLFALGLILYLNTGQALTMHPSIALVKNLVFVIRSQLHLLQTTMELMQTQASKAFICMIDVSNT